MCGVVCVCLCVCGGRRGGGRSKRNGSGEPQLSAERDQHGNPGAGSGAFHKEAGAGTVLREGWWRMGESGRVRHSQL